MRQRLARETRSEIGKESKKNRHTQVCTLNRLLLNIRTRFKVCFFAFALTYAGSKRTKMTSNGPIKCFNR